MLRFQQGQTEAFEELVRRNTPKIHGLIMRFLGGGQMVEDLTQEVFLRVFRTAGRYQPTAKFSTWLYRIAANLSFNALRARKKGRTVNLEISDTDGGKSFFADVKDNKSTPPHGQMDKHELRDKVAQAVSALSDKQRIAIILNKYEHKSYEEIANILNCSTMAVKSLLSRARENLRQSLSRYLRRQ